MPIFEYIAVNNNGKKVRAALPAPSMDAAKSSLRSTGYTLLEIKEQGALSLNRSVKLPFLGSPSPKDMSVFCRQFVSILRAGVPISTALGMLGQQTDNPKLAGAIREIQSDIEKGSSLAESMRRRPKIFSNLFVSIVAAGEESGNLEISFSQMELYFEKNQRTKSSVSKAMIYPCILMVAIISVLFVMMTKIIPRFLVTFNEMSIELPAITRVVMAVSSWFVKYWWLLAAMIAVLAVLGILFGRTDQGKHVYGWLTRKLPVVKGMTARSACAVFARTLSLLLSSGLTLPDSLELTANSMTNIWYREAVFHVRDQVSKGMPLHTALRDTGLFPSMVYHLTGIGEDTGDLHGMLAKTADYYESEAESASQKLLAMLEPVMILFMAFFVIVIVLSIFLPMLNMTSAYDVYL